jgi:hypothetical protein
VFAEKSSCGWGRNIIFFMEYGNGWLFLFLLGLVNESLETRSKTEKMLNHFIDFPAFAMTCK